MQLIHWFTSSKQEENEEKAALIDAVYVSKIIWALLGSKGLSALIASWAHLFKANDAVS